MVRAFFRHILNSIQAAVRQLIARCVPFLTSVKTVLKNNTNTATLLAVFVVLTSVAGAFSYTRGSASAAASDTLTFQGRLLSSSGSTVTDGSYNIEFNLYTQQAPGGTSIWTEDYLNSAAQGVTVKNGYFSVNLGSVNAFGTGINWDQQLYLGMTVRGTGSCSFGACTPADLEMTPRFKLTAVPYSFRSARLMNSTNTNSFTADDLAQLAPGTPQSIAAAVAALRLNQTSTGGLLQLQKSGTDVFTIGNDGAVLARNSTDSTAAFDVQDVGGNSFLKVDTLSNQATFGSSNGTARTILQGGSAGVQIASGSDVTIGVADANATLFVLDSKTTIGDPTGTNGAMYYNSAINKFRCFENGAWSDCLAGGGTAGASASFLSGLQNVTANQSGLTVETLVFTSATAVSNTAGVTGFTAPADGSFRTCMVKNNANVTAGTISLRWRVNGASVGSSICTLDSVNNRQSADVLNDGVVRFNAGDTIGIAFDTSNNFAPSGSNDFTVYWSVSYSSGGSSLSGSGTLQDAYDASVAASILTANNKDVAFTLADTAIDSNLVVDVASGSTGALQVKRAGTTRFSVDGDGNINTNAGITLGTSSSTTAGTIRWTGTDFEGYDGASWVSLTGGGSGGLSQNAYTVVKATNEVVNNSIALQDDNELSFAIGPNETWTYRYVVQANSGAAPDLRFAVTAPVGATCNVSYSDPEGASSIANVGCGVAMTAIPGNGAPDLYEITGSVINGSTPGNVTLQWAQNSLSATDTIVHAGSFLYAVRSVGPGGFGQPFTQGGNNFGATATIGTTGANDLSLITNNTERVRVVASGEVGIGTGGTPAALLSVGTSSAFQVNNAGNILTSGTLNVGGLSTFSGSLVANNTVTATTGTTAATPGTNTTTVVLAAAGSFANNDVIYIDNAGQDYYTRIVSGGGSTTLTVSPAVSYDASAPVTKRTVQNIGATPTDYSSQQNRFFQGYFLGGVVVGANSTTLSDGELSRTVGDINITPGSGGELKVNGTLDATTINTTTINASTITGDGSGLTNINGANITGASISDAALSSNVVLLTGAQTLTGAKAFSAQADFTAAGTGLTVTNGATVGSLTVNGASTFNGDITIGDAATDRVTINSQLLGQNALVFQGATDNAAATTLQITDPTTNRTITVPDADGTIAVSASGNIALSAAGNISLTGQIPIANGGTGASSAQAAINALAGLTTTGDLLFYDGTNATRLPRGSNGQCLTSTATSVQWGSCTTGAATGVGAISGTPNANGLTLNAGTLSLAAADGTNGGALTAGAQNIGGVKTFVDGLTLTTGKTLTVNGDALTDLTGSNLVNNSGALGVSATPSFTSVTAATFGGSAGVTLSSGGTGDLTLDAASNVLVLNDATLRRAAAGTTALQLNDTANTTFSITNTDGTAVANLSVEGSITATSFSGSGAGLTNIGDSALSSNVVLLTGTQTLSGLKTFGAGLTITTGQNLTVNGDTFTDLTGSNLTLSSGALGLVTSPTLTGTLTVPTITSTAGLALSGTTGISLNSGTIGTTATNVTLFSANATTVSAFGAATSLNIGNAGGTTTINGNTAVNGNTTIGDASTDRLTINAQVLGGTALVFQGATDNGFATTFAVTDPTANNTITVPNASGTMLLLGTAAAQADASTNASVSINKTGASGNILTLQKNGTDVFTIGNGGATAVSTTSTAALVIANAGAAVDSFSVDTSGNIVRIGDSTADATGTILVLDTKNTAGDPTAQDGAMYYNSILATMRCSQGNLGWTDCLGMPKPNTRRTTQITASGATTFTSLGDIVAFAGTNTAVAANTAEPVTINYATTNANGNVGGPYGTATTYNRSSNPTYQTYVQVTSTASERVWVGMTNQTAATMGASANPAGTYAAFRYDTSVGGETTWKCVTRDGTTQTINNSGVTVGTAGIRMEIIVGASSVVFKIDGTVVCTNTTNLPAAATMMRFSNSITNLSAATHNLRVAWIYVETDN